MAIKRPKQANETNAKNLAFLIILVVVLMNEHITLSRELNINANNFPPWTLIFLYKYNFLND
ncbi:hypothetical protein IV73_GL001182 [Weissella kandleri]|uniref:Uncharacterized protein n=1 Tax=Weissella kandleri TaxID=1616 RepID=A0A0R2JKV7_9LACO|nr:hypothetical protein IV73_GL001182 [Weissella kandleri]